MIDVRIFVCIFLCGNDMLAGNLYFPLSLAFAERDAICEYNEEFLEESCPSAINFSSRGDG